LPIFRSGGITIVAIGLLMFFGQARALAMLADHQAWVRPGGIAIVNVLVEGTTYMDMFTPGEFVVIHFGGVYGYAEMLPFTRLPNVWLETSVAFPRVVNGPTRNTLQFLVDEKRLDRLIFGSELPRDYDTVCGAIDKLLGTNPDPAVVRAIYRGNADRLLRISLSSQLLEEEQQREKHANVPDVMSALGAKGGSRIAEVGAGDGFWVVRLAPKVGPSGQVIGEDVSKEVADRLGRRVREDELASVRLTIACIFAANSELTF